MSRAAGGKWPMPSAGTSKRAPARSARHAASTWTAILSSIYAATSWIAKRTVRGTMTPSRGSPPRRKALPRRSGGSVLAGVRRCGQGADLHRGDGSTDDPRVEAPPTRRPMPGPFTFLEPWCNPRLGMSRFTDTMRERLRTLGGAKDRCPPKALQAVISAPRAR
jgi:hypothetical protein